jgi:DNA mismatch endonuclease, patch repair protein
MGRIRSRGNLTTELRLIQAMRRHRITGWRRGSTLPGRPDFVFKRAGVVVFVDGDFWHGNPRKYRLPKSNILYWRAKIEGNRARDKAVNRELRQLGWRVIRVWESALRNESRVIARIEATIHDAKR